MWRARLAHLYDQASDIVGHFANVDALAALERLCNFAGREGERRNDWGDGGVCGHDV